ncbi:hypothetical protein TNCV_3412301 [Trichonephila clavipes]|uniref:Uncharacterized protein n=1 Tax=Trichonephila clavipes TaxID=2585209 RepID=A0A8X6RRJ0_TRICX|nr:hypothetical protein TNCV_3412301 [Trichonephila clavipes]
MTDKNIWEFAQSSKNIIDADFLDENETNNAAPVPTSSEMRNIMNRGRGRTPQFEKICSNMIEEVVDVVQELLDFHNQRLTIDQFIEMPEQHIEQL